MPDRHDIEGLRHGLATLADRAPDDDLLLDSVHRGVTRRQTRRRAAAIATTAAAVGLALVLAQQLPSGTEEVPPGEVTPTAGTEPIDAAAFADAVVSVAVVNGHDALLAIDPARCTATCPRLVVTTDAGDSFHAIETSGLPDGVVALHFLDLTTGWATIRDDDGSQRPALRTSDGGRTWETESEPEILVAGGTAYAHGADYGTSNHKVSTWNGDGWETLTVISGATGPVLLTGGLAGVYAEYATAPAGAPRVTRRLDEQRPEYPSPCRSAPASMSGNASRLWLLCASGDATVAQPFTSSDGVHWEASPVQGVDGGGTIAAAGPDTAVAALGPGRLYVARPGSARPAARPTDLGQQSVTDVEMASSELGFLVTENGWLLRTTDGGSSWERLGGG